MWRRIIWRRGSRVVLAIWVLLTLWDTVQAQLFPASWQDNIPPVVDAISDQPWYVWVITGLSVVLLITLEGTYREASVRDAAPALPGLSVALSVEQEAWYWEPAYDVTRRVLGFKCSNLSARPIPNCRVTLVALAYWSRDSKQWIQQVAFSPQPLAWAVSGHPGNNTTLSIGPQGSEMCCLVHADTRDQLAIIAAPGEEQQRCNRLLFDPWYARCRIEADGHLPTYREDFFEWRPGHVVLGTQIHELEFVEPPAAGWESPVAID